MNVEAVYTAAMNLPEADRVLLADMLYRSIGSDEQQKIRQAWLEEVDRRRAAYLRGEVQTISYEEVMSAAKSRAAS